MRLREKNAPSTALRRKVATPLVCLTLWGLACGREPVTEEDLQPDVAFNWTRRDHVRAFYSGHSLSDGIPEAASEIAQSLGGRLEFEFQSIGYSLLRERTRGPDPSASGWDGYKQGKNRSGEGLDVASELRHPTRLAGGGVYDALVVTERHDLPDIAVGERSAEYLAHMATQALSGNPHADVFFYHTWLEIDVAAPQAWIRYERRAQRMWECVASRANRELVEQSSPGSPRIRVLPGALVLAELVEALFRGEVPGVALSSPRERVRLLFADQVHLSPLGKYFMGLVHYAILFGKSPVGAARPPGLSDEANAFMQDLAQREVLAYAKVANAAAQRDMEACRAFAEGEMCEAYHAFRAGRSWFGSLRRWLPTRRCRADYAKGSPTNPFR